MHFTETAPSRAYHIVSFINDNALLITKIDPLEKPFANAESSRIGCSNILWRVNELTGTSFSSGAARFLRMGRQGKIIIIYCSDEKCVGYGRGKDAESLRRRKES